MGDIVNVVFVSMHEYEFGCRDMGDGEEREKSERHGRVAPLEPYANLVLQQKQEVENELAVNAQKNTGGI